ncbi:MAG TPA: IS5 family transposase [Methanobacterium sp.]|jgi:IS5 family transposase|nr:IS5 family transposase [Methanobacterium sp.]
MKSFEKYFMNKQYSRVKELGDKLAEIDPLIDWEFFRPIVRGMYDNRSERGGRPNIDEIVMIKMLVLQSWYGLSDPELERQANDRISFQKFLGFPERIPDRSTVWAFRERLIDTGKDERIWEELQRQIDIKGLKVKEGVIQDATFITADPGHKKVNEPRGPEAKTRRNKEGEWAKKNGKSHYGYKLHTLTDIDYGLIRRIETTTAKVHDSQIDLSESGEVVYRDRGYFGAACKGYNATMKRAVRGHPLGIRDKCRNKRIVRKRSAGERPYAVIKNIFKSGHLLVTTTLRSHTKNLFTCFCYNLLQLKTLQKINTT